MEDIANNQLRNSVLSKFDFSSSKKKVQEKKEDGKEEKKGLLEKCLEHQLKIIEEGNGEVDKETRKKIVESFDSNLLGKLFRR